LEKTKNGRPRGRITLNVRARGMETKDIGRSVGGQEVGQTEGKWQVEGRARGNRGEREKEVGLEIGQKPRREL
jgi:hypothetical protein